MVRWVFTFTSGNFTFTEEEEEDEERKWKEINMRKLTCNSHDKFLRAGWI